MSAPVTPTSAKQAVRGPRLLALLWLLGTVAASFAVPVLIATVPYWHHVRRYLEWLGQGHLWLSIVCCVALLMLSQRRKAQGTQAWATGALPIWVMAGLLSALVLHLGVWPRWLVHSSSVVVQMQVLALMAVHGVAALMTFRVLRAFAHRSL